MNRSLLIGAVAVGLVAGLIAAWQARASIAPGLQSPVARPLSPGSPQRDEPVHRGAGRVQQPLGSLVVEVRSDGQPVSGVAVQVFRFERIDGAPAGTWRDPARGVTDAEGVARFQVPPTHHLVVATLGGKPVSKEIDVAAGTDRVVLEAAAEGRLTGTTLDAESKQPLGGVEVIWRPNLLAPAPGVASVRTIADSLGRFALEVPRGSTGGLEGHSPGYSAATASARVMNHTAPVELALEPASVAEGVVVDAKGAPVEGASVRSEPADGPAVLTSARGAFMLQIPAGGVTLEALTSAGRRGLLRINAAPARETVRGLKVVIDEGDAVTGLVIEGSTQKPVPNASVHLFSEPDALELATGTTDALGEFHFLAIPAGRYSLFAQLGAGARGRTVGLELPSATQPVVALTAAATISGRVVPADAAGGIEVALEFPPRLNEPGMRTRTNEAGEFMFEGVLASMVSVTATLGSKQTSDDVYAAPDKVTQVELTFERLARIHGRVMAATQSYRVMAWRNGGKREVSEPTADDGAFSLTLPPGTWQVTAQASHGSGAVMTFAEPVTLKSGDDLEVNLSPPLILDGGHLYDAFGGLGDGIAFDAENGSVKVGFLSTASRAYKVGLRSGDLVMNINGANIANTLQAFEQAKAAPADYVVRRSGAELRFRIATE